METRTALHLRKFDMSSMRDNANALVIGRRATGKSFLVRDMLWHRRDIPYCTVVSPTESICPFYSDIVPAERVHDEFAPAEVSLLLHRQRKALQGKRDDPRSLLVLDNCLDKPITSDDGIRDAIVHGRHHKMFVALTITSYRVGLSANLWANVDYTFILRENMLSERRGLYDSIGNMFPTLEVFCDVLDQCTENYECLVICNNTTSNRLEDRVFWYKAPEHPPFKACAGSEA